MSSGLVFTLILCGLGIGGNLLCDAVPVGVIEPWDFCPLNWTYFGGRCYLFKENEKDWDDAEDFCNLFDAHLTSIQGDDDYNFIRELVLKATGTNTRTWVGGTDAEEEGYWVWTDGSPFTFTAWGSGEPNNVDGNENCMEINLRGQDYVNDENCSRKNSFICAKDA
ncbi:galactose-specific lectin nattectin-like [Kryptolebias marmoratus]|uniref:Galactose-specific lectin nattectin-like n=1 Tax=Kryptolebias marmoratus TaxID=37003 RepID=A0A3Q3AMH4_KRYMA|nr:galactose-specific lectin nattectin-like [Kryptolebias marmoratus]